MLQILDNFVLASFLNDFVRLLFTVRDWTTRFSYFLSVCVLIEAVRNCVHCPRRGGTFSRGTG